MAESNSVSLGPNDRLVGQLYIEGDVRLSGTVEGQIEATGTVEVAEAGNVKASLAGRQVSISGKVDGPVTAGDRLLISRSGSLKGDVKVPRLVIQDGAQFSGNIQMGKGASPPAAQPGVATEPAAAPAAQSQAEVVADAAVVAEAQTDKSKVKKR